MTEIANKIDKTISSGTITDPMGAGILLQGAGSFDSDNYQLVGWRKDEQGTWVEAPDLVANVQVAEADQTITVSNLALGENERVTLTYQIRLDTEDSSFQGETWVLCNGRTTLVPEVDGEAVDFPIPSIKAPVVSINVLKKWVNVSAAEIPEQIEYQVQRMTTTSEQGWQISDPLTLSKEDDFQVTLSEVPVNGQQLVLPKYNNQGEDFSYTVTEINVPEDFESTVTNDGETIILTNTKKETEPSTTEPSTTESNNDHSSTSQTSQSSDQVGGSVTTTTSSQNNGGVLPQTNEKRAAWLVVLGTIIVSGVLATVFKKK